MYKPTTLLAATLLLANSLAQAETRNTNDLTYCLALPTAQLIAKCSGELAPGVKGRTLTQAEVDKILSEHKSQEPAAASTPPVAPAEIHINQPAAAPVVMAPVTTPAAEPAAAPVAEPATTLVDVQPDSTAPAPAAAK